MTNTFLGPGLCSELHTTMCKDTPAFLTASATYHRSGFQMIFATLNHYSKLTRSQGKFENGSREWRGGVKRERVSKKGLGFDTGMRLVIILGAFFLFGGSGSINTAGSSYTTLPLAKDKKARTHTHRPPLTFMSEPESKMWKELNS